MNSPWAPEILAILKKEWNAEIRSKSGILTVTLFSFTVVVAIAFSTFSKTVSGTVAAGQFWVALLFASIVAMPRVFLVEEELGTADLLRLTARPHAVFWGKALYNFGLMMVTSFFLAGLFVLLARMPVTDPLLLGLSLIGSAATLSAGVTLSSALVAQAANRAALAGAVALPLLLPIIALGVTAIRVALGDGLSNGGYNGAVGLFGYGIVSFAIGPYIFAAVWKN